MTENDPATPAWECSARKQGTPGGNAPADCDWPGCGCDPSANKVLEAIDEAGLEIRKKPAPFGEGGLAGTFERYAKRFADHKTTVEVTLTPSEIQQISNALAALQQSRRDEPVESLPRA